MRFAAQGFVKLMSKFPFLESLAFIVIFILGIKLVVSYICEYFHGTRFCEFVNGHYADLVFSILTTSVFVLPVLSSLAFNFPKRSNISGSEAKMVDGGKR
jgi:predicted tellurium resistance membrane protein TerC